MRWAIGESSCGQEHRAAKTPIAPSVLSECCTDGLEGLRWATVGECCCRGVCKHALTILKSAAVCYHGGTYGKESLSWAVGEGGSSGEGTQRSGLATLDHVSKGRSGRREIRGSGSAKADTSVESGHTDHTGGHGEICACLCANSSTAVDVVVTVVDNKPVTPPRKRL